MGFVGNLLSFAAVKEF